MALIISAIKFFVLISVHWFYYTM